MQNEQFEDGAMRALAMQSIDTGMGLERIGALLQGKHDNYDTDLMRALIEASAHATNSDPDGDGKTHHRVIADHLRSTSFLIADGVMPSNEGRGYVLRRIMRRAMRHAHLVGAKDPVMHRLVPELVRQMGQAFPSLAVPQVLIEETLLTEETRFKATLDRGLKLLDEELAALPDQADLPGETAFKLYDTYGFPLDLTQDALREKGRTVDTDGFDAAMAEQKAKARAAWSGSGEAADATIWYDIAEDKGTTEFLGYDTEKAEGQVQALVKDGAKIDAATTGTQVQIVVNQTPFYAEAGGQVGDTGFIRTETGEAKVTDTRKVAGVFLHVAEVTKGQIELGQGAELVVDHMRRSVIRANHSATHLLNEALRQELGEHVAQRGSLNAPDRLRFDFSHNKALTAQQLENIAMEVNAYIRQNASVETRVMPIDEARELGAQALFGEKYGDEVRVVSMGKAPTGKGANRDTYSIELCGGTHVKRTGDIGVFVLLGDSASAAGVRRVEALTGKEAFAYLEREAGRVAALAGLLKAQPGESGGPGESASRREEGARGTGLDAASRAGHVGRRRRGGQAQGHRRRAVSGAGAERRVRQGPAAADRRTQGGHRLRRGAVDRRHRRQGGRCRWRDRRSHRPALGGRDGPRRGCGTGRQGRRRPARHGPGRRQECIQRRGRGGRRRNPDRRIGHARAVDCPCECHRRRGLRQIRRAGGPGHCRTWRRIHRPRRALRAARGP